MNILQKIVSKVLGTTKTYDGSWYPEMSSSSIQSLSSGDYIKYFKSWQYIAITTIADAMSSQKYILKNRQGNERQHPYMKFITSEFLNSVAHTYELFGTAYVLMIRASERSPVLGLRLLRPDLMIEDFDHRNNLLAWNYYGNNSVSRLNKEDVLVFADRNPYQEYPNITRGLSKLSASANTIVNDEIGTIRNQQNMTEGNTKNPVITSEQKLTEDQIRVMKKMRDDNHGGLGKQNKASFLANGFKIQNLNPTPKDMDYALQQKRDAEKILATYRVPKAVIGMGEGVNVGNVTAFNTIFAERCLTPLASKISSVLTEYLFGGIGTFEFVNLIPIDENNIRNNYNTGLISQNEGRNAIGYKSVKEGDVFVDGLPATVEIPGEAKKVVKKSMGEILSKNFEIALKGVTAKKRSEEWMEKKISAKTNRMKKYYKPYNAKLQTIFAEQEKDILKQYDNQTKDIKKVTVKLGTNYINSYLRLLGPVQSDLMKGEGQLALAEVSKDAFDVNTPKSKKIQKEILTTLAKGVDSVTDGKITAVIDAGIQAGLSPDEVRVTIQGVFTQLSKTRAESIVRTETMRAATQSQIIARDQSDVVSGKERYTALDERVCEYCEPMHGKTIGLNDNYFKKGDKYKGRDGGTMKLDYSDTQGSPLHSNCRCDLIPKVK